LFSPGTVKAHAAQRHAPRTETPIYARTHKQRVAVDNRCWVCRRTAEESGHPRETHHHPIERSLAEMIDFELVQADCVAGEYGDAARQFDREDFWNDSTPRPMPSPGKTAPSSRSPSAYASVPRVPVAYRLFGDTTHAAAVIHDWLYHHHEVCDEATTNRVLLEAAKVAKIPRRRRLGIYLGVKIGGESSWEEDGRGNGHQLVNGVIV